MVARSSGGDDLRDHAAAEEDQDHGPGELGEQFADQCRDLESFRHVPSFAVRPMLRRDGCARRSRRGDRLTMWAERTATCIGIVNEHRSTLSNAVHQGVAVRDVPGSVQSIERAAAILRLLAGGSGRLGVGEIAGSLGPGQGHRPRHPAHAAARRLRRAGHATRASTSSARRCCTWARATSTSTSCGRGRSTGPTRWPRAAARRSGSARSSTARCSSCTTCSGPTTRSRPLDIGSLLPLHATRARQGAARVRRAARRAVAQAELGGVHPAHASSRPTELDRGAGRGPRARAGRARSRR